MQVNAVLDGLLIATSPHVPALHTTKITKRQEPVQLQSREEINLIHDEYKATLEKEKQYHWALLLELPMSSHLLSSQTKVLRLVQSTMLQVGARGT